MTKKIADKYIIHSLVLEHQIQISSINKQVIVVMGIRVITRMTSSTIQLIRLSNIQFMRKPQIQEEEYQNHIAATQNKMKDLVECSITKILKH